MDSPSQTAPRAKASLNLVGVLAAVVLAAVFMPGLPRYSERTANAPDNVRLVTAPASTSCADQVWPHIDARCLKRADAPADKGNAPNARAPAADAALSPLTITAVRPGMAPLAKDADEQGGVPVATPAMPQAAPPAAAPPASVSQAAQRQPAVDFSRTYTAGAAVEGVEAEEGAADVPVPRPKKRHGHRPFSPFGFLGIRF